MPMFPPLRVISDELFGDHGTEYADPLGRQVCNPFSFTFHRGERAFVFASKFSRLHLVTRSKAHMQFLTEGGKIVL